MRSSVFVVTVSALAGLFLCACGQSAPDLFVVDRDGYGRGAKLRLIVSDDGSVRCDASSPLALGDQRLLQARDLARKLQRPAALELKLAPGHNTVLSYHVRLAAGHVVFFDSSHDLPKVLQQLTAFTKDVAENTCRVFHSTVSARFDDGRST